MLLVCLSEFAQRNDSSWMEFWGRLRRQRFRSTVLAVTFWCRGQACNTEESKGIRFMAPTASWRSTEVCFMLVLSSSRFLLNKSVPILWFQDPCQSEKKYRVPQIHLKMILVSLSARTVAFRLVEVDKARSRFDLGRVKKTLGPLQIWTIR